MQIKDSSQTEQKIPPQPIQNVSHKSGKRPTLLSVVGEIVQFIIIGAVLYFGIRLYIAQPFIVSGSSMVPNFEHGDYLIIDELSYHMREPERGEVVVFRYPNDPSKYFIKRVIALPDETVSIANNKVSVKNSAGTEVLNEPYVAGLTSGKLDRTLGPNEYFVMGDNREASSDSRSWGPVPREHIVGRALVRLFPIAQAQVLPGDERDVIEQQ